MLKIKKRLMLGKIESFLNPKIFIRQSAKQIICAFNSKHSTSNNLLYMIGSSRNYKFSLNELLFLTGFLNSDIISFYAEITNIIKYYHGKQPQIRINDLRKLPIITDVNLKNKIANLVKDIYDSKFTQENIDKVNMLIFEYFNYDLEQINYIKNYLKNF